MALGALAGPLISAGTSLISGLLGRSSAKKQAKREEDAIRRANEQAQEAAAQMNKQVRARADAAALVPVQTERAHDELRLSRSTTATAGSVDMAAFMNAAESNGFNPLTFLRSGALSLFATSISTTDSREQFSSADWTCTTGERAMDAALSGTYIPSLNPVISQTKVPGIGDVLGNALTSGANQYLSDLSQQQNNQFQMDLLNRQLQGAQQRDAMRAGRSGYVPQAFLYGSVKTGNGAGAGPAAGNERIPAFIEIFDNRPGSPTNGQSIWVVSPDAGSAESALIPGLYDTRPGGGGFSAFPEQQVHVQPGSAADSVKQIILNTIYGPGPITAPGDPFSNPTIHPGSGGQ